MTAKAAGTDSSLARLVPMSVPIASMSAAPVSRRPIATACWMRSPTRPAPLAPNFVSTTLAAFSATASASSNDAPSMPALMVAATAAAPLRATAVLCVRALTSITRLTKASTSALDEMMPTGAMRIAAPLVVPDLPDTAGSTPDSILTRASLVDGPSRSKSPRWRTSCSQRTRRRA